MLENDVIYLLTIFSIYAILHQYPSVAYIFMGLATILTDQQLERVIEIVYNILTLGLLTIINE